MPQNLRIRNLRIRPMLFGALAMLIATIGLRADTIVYNSFGPGMTITPLPNPTDGYFIGPPTTVQYFGAPFIPSATVDLTSLTGSWGAALNDVASLTNKDAPITVSLWSGSSSGPASELESWALTVSLVVSNYTLTSTMSPELVAGDTYWVLAGYTGAVPGENDMVWGINSAATTLGMWDSLESATTLEVILDNTAQPALEVQGTPTTVAEPSTFLLTGIGFLSIMMKSHWRRFPLR
jgi:hypothetical protein